MFFKKKAPKPILPVIKKLKISLDISYLQNGKVYTSCYSYNVETDNQEEMETNSRKILDTLESAISNIYTQLNDKTSEYIYIEEQSFILNKKDFLNCNITKKIID
jgi:hypothetical protein